MKNRRFATLCTMTLALAGGPVCSGDSAAELEVRIYGEEFIESGIPAAEVSDGWSITFERFLITIGEVSLQKGHGAAAFADSTSRVFDLTKKDPSATAKGQRVLNRPVPAGDYDHFDYRIARATAASQAGSPLPDGALSAMAAAGDAVWVKGQATKDGKTVSFDWHFGEGVSHSCHAAIAAEGRVAKQITIHGDHLFYDDLVAAEPDMAFGLIATSDANGDGQVTREELAAKDITQQAKYQVGNFPVKDLWAFIAHQVTTLGHVDGEGHCSTKRE